MTAHGSLWRDTHRTSFAARFEPLPATDTEIDTDVAIVGGGIVGAACALLLTRAGHHVTLLEALRMGAGSTGGSTAKCTALPAGTLATLVEELGIDDARLLAGADRASLELLQRWHADGVISELEVVPHWLWAATDDGEQTLSSELDAARQLGFGVAAPPDGPPFGRSAGGVTDQLLIEPALLCAELAAAAQQGGARIHEQTRVSDIDPQRDGGALLATDTGATIRARRVILATLVPQLDRSLLFAASGYRRSHAIALERGDAAVPPMGVMLTCLDPSGLSMRPARAADGTQLIVVAGHGHPLDEDEDGSHLDALERAAHELIGPGIGARTHGWLAHDAFPHDKRPFVGAMRGADDIYVASGFGGWGLARGVTSAQLITQLIAGEQTELARVLDADRLGPFATKSTVTETARIVRPLVIDRFTGAASEADLEALQPGEGRVAYIDGRLVAVARDADGTLHTVGANCTHQGCVVRHDAERGEWQCPCHGSRFALDGSLLAGPAATPLPAREV